MRIKSAEFLKKTLIIHNSYLTLAFKDKSYNHKNQINHSSDKE
jgi:hypothetical protein